MEALFVTAIGSLAYLVTKAIFGQSQPNKQNEQKNTSFYQERNNNRLNITFRTNISDSQSQNNQIQQQEIVQRKKKIVSKNGFGRKTKKQLMNEKFLDRQKLVESRLMNEEDIDNLNNQNIQNDYKLFERDQQPEEKFYDQEQQPNVIVNMNNEIKDENQPKLNTESKSLKTSSRRMNINIMKILSQNPKNSLVLIEKELQNQTKSNITIGGKQAQIQSSIDSYVRDGAEIKLKFD